VTRRPARSLPAAKLRRGRIGDLDALVELERAVFPTDILSRRSFRRFLTASSATLLVAESAGQLAGYVLVLYPRRSKLARLYSIAVAPHLGRRGLGPLLLAAAEQAARRRGRRVMRLEVRERNRRAIARYKKPATACSGGTGRIMTIAPTRSASTSRLLRNRGSVHESVTYYPDPGYSEPWSPKRLSWWTIAGSAVAILSNSGYDQRVPRLTPIA